QANSTDEALPLSEREGKHLIDEMANHVRYMGKRAEQEIDSNIRLFKDESLQASRITIALSIISLIAGFTLAMLVTYSIARPLKKLEKATALIAEGRFQNDLNMNRQDAIGSLAGAFIIMAERLKILEASHRDASPLTGLPGNLAIEKPLAMPLAANRPFSLCHLDPDNYKPFANNYGYAWGSEIIKEVGQIITEQAKTRDGHEVFIGHIGGDDFVLITEPRPAEEMCQAILQEVGQRSLKLYAEDRRRAF
ncbi:MAG: diguanylate cyclase, partial [Syntrophales bacterium LBB04]|nr:diguanylate cyclase [Syntrophales bacterium LBB04]